MNRSKVMIEINIITAVHLKTLGRSAVRPIILMAAIGFMMQMMPLLGTGPTLAPSFLTRSFTLLQSSVHTTLGATISGPPNSMLINGTSTLAKALLNLHINLLQLIDIERKLAAQWKFIEMTKRSLMQQLETVTRSSNFG